MPLFPRSHARAHVRPARAFVPPLPSPALTSARLNQADFLPDPARPPAVRRSLFAVRRHSTPKNSDRITTIISGQEWGVSPRKDAVCHFGAFEFDVRNLELRKSGVRLKLQDQPRQVLIELLDHPGELVSREELRSLLWQENTFVDFETGLNTAVKRLRETLGDSADNPTFIETIPRRGYKFIAPVEWTVRDNAVAPSTHIPASTPRAPSVPITAQHGRTMKLVVRLSAFAVIAAVVFFVVENRYFTHTRLGAFLQRTIGATRSTGPRT